MPQPLALERERVGIAVRERVLDGGARRQLAVGRHVEQRRISVSSPGRGLVHSRSIIRGAARPAAWAARPIFARRLGPWLSAVVAARSGSPRRARAADPTLARGSTARSRCRTSTRPAPPRSPSTSGPAPSSTRATPRSRSSRRRTRSWRWPTRRWRCSARATGSTPRWWASARSSATSGTATSGCAALATRRSAGRPRRARGRGRRLGDPPRRRGRARRRVVVRRRAATAPGWKPRFFIEESPPLSALVVDRGVYRGRTRATRRLRPPRSSGSARGARHRVAGRTRTRRADDGGLPLAQDLSQPLAEIVRFMGRESDNFTAELLVKQLGALDAGRGTTAAGARVVRRRSRTRASRSPASGSRTAPVSRASTA